MADNEKRIEERIISLENNVRVTIHYERGGESLEDKMIAVLAAHISRRPNVDALDKPC